MQRYPLFASRTPMKWRLGFGRRAIGSWRECTGSYSVVGAYTPPKAVAAREHRTILSVLKLLGPTALLLASAACAALAQNVDQRLWGVAPYASISTTAVSGNTLYVGGNFDSAAPVVGGGAVTDSRTGALLPSSPRIAGSVRACIPDGRGGWFIGGEFRGVGSVPRANLAHIYASGRVDAWSPDPDGPVYALTISGHTLYVGGTFGTFSGQQRSNVAGVDLETMALTSWSPQVQGGYVFALLPARDRVYIGGGFYFVGGEIRPGLAAVDIHSGQLARWDPGLAGGDGTVYALALHNDTLIVGGSFGQMAGAGRFHLAAFDIQTGLLTSWSPRLGRIPLNFHFDGGYRVFAMALHGDHFFVGGSFNRVGDTVRPALAEIDLTTGEATHWDPQVRLVTPSDIPIIHGMSLDAGHLYVSGTLDDLGGQPARWCGAIDEATGLRAPWDPSPNLFIDAIAATGAATYIGGGFTSVGPVVPRHGLAAFDLRTGRVTPWDPGPNGQPLALVPHDGLVYVAGEFGSIGGKPRSGIAAVDSVTGAATDWNPQASGPVWSVAFGDTTAFLGGFFNQAGGQLRSSLAEVGLNSGTATPWNPSPNDAVTSLAVHRGKVYVGGWFTSIGSSPRAYLAALDPQTGLASGWDAHADDIVDCIAVEDTTLFVGGYITRLGGQPRSGLGAVSTLSGVVTAMQADMNGEARRVVIRHGVLYVGGSFTQIGTRRRKNLAAVDASDGSVLDWNPDPDGSVWALAADDSRVYPGGDFGRMGPIAVSLMAAVDQATLAPLPPRRSGAGPIAAMDVTNPYRPGGIIHFALRTTSPVSLKIFDMQGRKVTTLLDHTTALAGEHELPLEATGLRPGVYFFQLESGATAVTRKMVFLE